MYFKILISYSFVLYALTLLFVKINENSSYSIALKHLEICQVLECNILTHFNLHQLAGSCVQDRELFLF